MSARMAMDLPARPVSMRPTTLRGPTTSQGMPSFPSSSTMRAEVHSSSIESSGWACSSRRKSVTYPAY